MDGENFCPLLKTTFIGNMRGQMWRVNALLMVNAILVAVMVGIGAYGHRYRHRPFSRFLYDGATSLFLPIMSYVVSDVGNYYVTALVSVDDILVVECDAGSHMLLVLIWTALVQIVAINTSAIVAGDDREGRNIGPQVVLLVQAIWTSYLAVYNIGIEVDLTVFSLRLVLKSLASPMGCFLLVPFAIIFSKMVFKFYAFYKVRQSFALGRNPRLIVGYMEQLQDGSQHIDLLPPPLLVTGEETVQVEKQPHGYCFKWMSDQGGTTGMNSNGLVTIDKVWQLDDTLLAGSITGIKDVCLSFALFKLLRCRFARYTVTEAGFQKVYNFFWHVLLKVKDSDDGRVKDSGRVLGVIADELSFLYDYYYSSLPISYPNRWLPTLSIFISLLTFGYCLFAVTALIPAIMKYYQMHQYDGRFMGQVSCSMSCNYRQCDERFMGHESCHMSCNRQSSGDIAFGSSYFDIVPVYLLLALVMLTEARDIASYICCNWTKVVLVCHFVNHASWQQSPTMRKYVGRLLQCRCKLLKHWEDKMNQCSILVLHPRKTPVALLRRLIPDLPDQKKNIKVPRAVKAAVVDAVRSYEGRRSNCVTSLRTSLQVGNNFLWAFNGKGTADTMLVCHIATSILEVRSQLHASNDKITATHLSCYCAYLVNYSPELLPDDDAWCKSLYKAVKTDAMRVLAAGIGVSTPEAEYQQLVELLSARSKHEVLKDGARLGKRLAELVEGEEMAWKVLAGFWTEMILYVAPSDNLNGHAEAIARGGELITLLWALLAHVGIVSRPDATAASTAGDPVAV